MFRLALLLFLLCAWTPLHAQALRVVATVKPLHSLVAGVMQGAGQPDLLLTGSESPHHYSLRPSERRMLADAALVFWIGPHFETFLIRLMQPGHGQRSIALIDTAGLEILPARAAHEAHESEARPDPHIWLSVHNARLMVDEIAKQLIELDPGQQHLYRQNRETLHARLDALDAELHEQIQDLRAPYLSYHDAYQYFENTHRLNNAGFVNSSDELRPGARRVRELRETIRRERIGCLFYETPAQPALVETLQHGYDLQAVEIDPLGRGLAPGADLWFALMRSIASGFAGCLRAQTDKN